MRNHLMLLACLAGVGAGTLVVASPVLAQGTALFADAGHFQLLEPASITADGSTDSLHIVMLEPDGRPMSGFKGKVSATSGSAGALQDKGGGLYSFPFTSAPDSTGSDVTFTLKGKTSSKASVEQSWTINLQPSLPTAVTVTANPQELVLGQDEGASLSIKLTGPGGSTVGDNAALSVRAASGSVESLTPLGGGMYTARYVPKQVQYPHLDIITMTDARDPDKVYGVYVMKLTGKTDFPVTSKANASVMMRVGDREFGPYNTDTQGKAKVPIVVGPGVAQATIVTIKDGKTTEEPLDLQVPETKRVSLFPIGGTVSADATQPVTIRVAVRTPTGDPDIYSRLTITSTAGQVGEAEHEGEGIYKATWTPVNGSRASTATIKVSVNGAPGVQSDEMNVEMAPARPTSLTITPEPGQLSEVSNGFKIYSKVQAASGGLTGAPPAILVSGAEQRGTTRDLKGGDYETSFATTGNESVRVTALATGPASTNPLNRVVLLPAEERVSNDGRSVVVLTVLTVDRFGYPVPNQEVTLKVSGDGKLKKQATTDDHGAATVYYTSGAAPGVVNIRGSVGDISGSASLLQAPEGVAPGFSFPGESSFDNQVKSIIIEREGASGVAATPDDMSGEAGALARLEVSASPAQVVPGGTATITVEAKDDAGRGVAGETLNILANGGTATTVQDKGGGTYTLDFTVGEGSNSAMVVVTNSDGTVTQAANITVNVPAWGSGGSDDTSELKPITGTGDDAPELKPITSTGDATPELKPITSTGDNTPELKPVTSTEDEPQPEQTLSPVTTTTETVVKQPKPPREPGAFPNARIRLGVGGGTYAYAQEGTDGVDSVLWDENVYLGGEKGTGGPASPLALDARAAVWLPMFTYVGVDAHFRMASYSIEWPGADADIPDQVFQGSLALAARYPFMAGSNQFHIGAKAGWLYGDFISYQDGGNDTQLDYKAVPVQSLGTSAEIGAEFGQGPMRGYLNAGVLAGWRGSVLYSRGIALDVGLRPDVSPVGLAATFQVTNRDVDLQDGSGNVLGTLSDTQVLIMGGPTIEF